MSKEENSSGAKWTPVQAPKCPVCNKSVFFAEEIKALGNSYHKTCFACVKCHKTLHVAADACDTHGQIYCKACYSREYAPKGIGFGFLADTGAPKSTDNKEREGARNAQGKSELSRGENSSEAAPPSVNNIRKTYDSSGAERSSSKKDNASSKFGKAPECEVCRGPVYHAEKINALGKTFHKSCFRCNECGKSLHTAADASDGEGLIFCNACYNKKYRPKGIGFGALADTGVPRPTEKK